MLDISHSPLLWADAFPLRSQCCNTGGIFLFAGRRKHHTNTVYFRRLFHPTLATRDQSDALRGGCAPLWRALPAGR